jgi:hypothetical protein
MVVEQPHGYQLAYVGLLRKEITPQLPADASWFWQLIASYRPVREAQWQPVPRYGAIDADRDLAEAAWYSAALHAIVTSRCFPLSIVWTALQSARACRSMIYGSQLLAARCRFATAPAVMVMNGPWKIHWLTSDDNRAELFEDISG